MSQKSKIVLHYPLENHERDNLSKFQVAIIIYCQGIQFFGQNVVIFQIKRDFLYFSGTLSYNCVHKMTTVNNWELIDRILKPRNIRGIWYCSMKDNLFTPLPSLSPSLWKLSHLKNDQHYPLKAHCAKLANYCTILTKIHNYNIW